MALRLRAVQGDGTTNEGGEFDLVVKDPETGQRLEDVVIHCRVVTKTRANEITRSFQHQVPDPKTRQMVWEFGEDGATLALNALLAEAIVGWRGFVGCDDRDLVCVPATIAVLDDRVKNQVIAAVFGAEVVAQQSFRESPRVLSLATGPR